MRKMLKQLFRIEKRENTEVEVKYLIVGLGNIGMEYEETRHNIGFKILDALVEASNTNFKQQRYGAVAEVKYKGRTLMLLKPSTYMNLSGNAVRYWLQQSKLELDKLMVIVDDVALPFGAIRIRMKGSDGGHNGLRSINQTLGTNNYTRLRFGIGSDFPRGYQADYVLGEWTKEERKELPFKINDAVDVINSFATIGLERTMNIHNK